MHRLMLLETASSAARLRARASLVRWDRLMLLETASSAAGGNLVDNVLMAAA